jgi:hypothetical protein
LRITDFRTANPPVSIPLPRLGRLLPRRRRPPLGRPVSSEKNLGLVVWAGCAVGDVSLLILLLSTCAHCFRQSSFSTPLFSLTNPHHPHSLIL